MDHPFPPAAGFQEFPVQLPVPVPGKAEGAEGFVEGNPVQLLGFGEGFVHVENERVCRFHFRFRKIDRFGGFFTVPD